MSKIQLKMALTGHFLRTHGNVKLCVISIAAKVDAMPPDDIPKWEHVQVKSMKPKIKPWGTSHFISWIPEEYASILTRNLLSMRYEMNHLKTVAEGQPCV